MTNATAIQAITSAVEGTIGPKGLDTMLVDRFGDVTITNAGVTILDKMEVNHPAARMLINAAKAQQEEIGDGTTTTTILAGALVTEGLNQVLRGVPVARVMEGMRVGLRTALDSLERRSRPTQGLFDPLLRQVAYVAGREHNDIADSVVRAMQLIGLEKLQDRAFKLADTVIAQEGAANEVFLGLIIERQRLNQQMPQSLAKAKLLIVDDAFEPEAVEDEALATEAGFARHLDLQREFKANIAKVITLGVSLVLVNRGVHPMAEEMLADAGVMVVSQVAASQWRRAAEHCGARTIKRTGLAKDENELVRCLGNAEQVIEDEKLGQVRILGGTGKPIATILVGATTSEVVGERQRMAKDAASAVQAAIRGGYVPGGGAIELAIARDVELARAKVKGMPAYGLDCVSSALRKPLAQIIANAGFNPLEKVEEVIAAQIEHASDSLAINCDTGELADMWELGIIDPTLVKLYALKAASEIAEAILRIDTIIKKKDEDGRELQIDS